MPMAVEVLSENAGYVPSATLFIADVAPDPAAAIGVCHAVHAQRPNLPIVALVCCPHAVTSWQLRELVASGVGNVLDFYTAADELSRIVHRIAGGDAVVRLDVAQPTLLEAIVGAPHLRHSQYSVHDFTETDIRILESLAHGMSDREIGSVVHLSVHTVKHHVERLRQGVRARNRVELAAWAGQQGLLRRSPNRA